MRGAGLRLNNDVRRIWRCAACGAERRAGAFVTSVRCECAGNPTMNLIEGRRLERPLEEAASPYLEFVFEPGELNPPRPPVEEAPPEPTELDGPPGEGDSANASAEQGVDTRPRAPQGNNRPPRGPDRNPRRPAHNSGPGPGSKDAGDRPPRGPRPDRSPRSPDAAQPGPEPSDAAPSEPPSSPRPSRRERGRRDSNRNPPPAPPSDGFGDGIPDPTA
jgi:hypothetical protein